MTSRCVQSPLALTPQEPSGVPRDRGTGFEAVKRLAEAAQANVAGLLEWDPRTMSRQRRQSLIHNDAVKRSGDEPSDDGPNPLAYCIDDLAIATSISRSALYEEVASGNLAAKKFRARTLILREAAVQWLERLPDVVTKGQD